MEHDAARELTAAHALGALDAAESSALEEHLATCERCRDELSGLLEAASALAFAVDAPAPPTVLRERVLSAARAERPNVVPLRPRRVRGTLLAAVTAAAVSAAAAVALAIYAADLSRDLDSEREARSVLADPAARDVALRGADGRLVVSPSGEAVLVASLDPAPGERTYKLWIVRGNRPLPDGAFDGESTDDVIRLDGRVRRGDVVAVTVERNPEVQAPTTTPFVTAQA
jgi:anti-sigma factor RsiW